MPYTAIMGATPEGRLAKYAEFATEGEANAHVAFHIARFPDAFVVPTPAGPDGDWLLDMAAKTVTIVPPPPPDFAAIDQATVDRLLLSSSVMRALAMVQFQIINDVRALEGKNPITTAQYKAKLRSLIR